MTIKTLNLDELKIYMNLKDDMDTFNKLLISNKIQGYTIIVNYKNEKEEQLFDYYFSALNEELLIGATEKINKGLLSKYIHIPSIQ